MSKVNPFNSNRSDLGVGDSYGYDRDAATEQLLYQPVNKQACYVCGNNAKYRILAKQPEYNTAQIQNGLYICEHDLRIAPIDPIIYGIRELQ
jgi:hypothetical protein